MVATRYIYVCRCLGTQPSFIKFKYRVQSIQQVERKSGQMYEKTGVNEKKWEPLMGAFDQIMCLDYVHTKLKHIDAE